MEDGWENVKLGEITTIESGGTPSTKSEEYWDSGNIFWVTLLDQKNKYIYNTQRKITELGLKKSSAKLLPKNTVIFSSRATIGEVSIIKEEMSTNQGSKNFICNPSKINYEFLYYLLKANVIKIKHIASGATYKEINKTVFSNFELIIPKDIKEQQKIATILSNYDDLIENNEKRIKILENIAKLIYEEWFVRFKFPGHEKVEMVDSGTEFGMIPEGWGVDLAEIFFKLEYGKHLPKWDRKRGDIPVIGSGGITGYHNKYLIESPGIVLGRAGKIGQKAVYYSHKDFFPLETTYYVSVEDKTKIRFLNFLLKNFNMTNTGSAVPNLSRKNVHNTKMIIPDMKIVKKFDIFSEKIFSIMDNLQQKNQNLKKTRDLLLPKLISGEIDVTELDIELNQEVVNT